MSSNTTEYRASNTAKKVSFIPYALWNWMGNIFGGFLSTLGRKYDFTTSICTVSYLGENFEGIFLSHLGGYLFTFLIPYRRKKTRFVSLVENIALFKIALDVVKVVNRQLTLGSYLRQISVVYHRSLAESSGGTATRGWQLWGPKVAIERCPERRPRRPRMRVVWSVGSGVHSRRSHQLWVCWFLSFFIIFCDLSQ